MDEARTFLRYLTPGFTFALEAASLLAITDWPTLSAALGSLMSSQQALTAIGVVIGSGAIGVVLSQLHHWLHWNVWTRLGVARDHREVLERLNAVGALAGGGLPAELSGPWTPREAWVAATILWYSRLGGSERLRGADPRTAGLSDLVHSTGTVLVGAMAATMTWAVIGSRTWPGWLAAGVLLALHAWSYRSTSWLAGKTIDGILETELKPMTTTEVDSHEGGGVREAVVPVRTLPPAWDLSQERVFIENLLGTRFNFFVVIYSVFVAGGLAVENGTARAVVASAGAVVLTLLSLPLIRAQHKLDLILDGLFRAPGHPVGEVHKNAHEELQQVPRIFRRVAQASQRRVIGYWLPLVCVVAQWVLVAYLWAAVGGWVPGW